MTLSDFSLSEYYPLIVTVSCIVGAIVALRIFFTLWTPLDRLLNGDRRMRQFFRLNLNELKGQTIDVYLKSGETLKGLQGVEFLNSPPNIPHQMRSLMKGQLPGGSHVLVRIDEILYFNTYTPGT